MYCVTRNLIEYAKYFFLTVVQKNFGNKICTTIFENLNQKPTFKSNKILQNYCKNITFFPNFFFNFFFNFIVNFFLQLKNRACPVLSRGTGRDRLSKSRLVPSRGKIFSLSRCPFVPGQLGDICPVVPLSRDN